MAARVEHGVELARARDQVGELVGVLPDVLLLGEEGLAYGVVLAGVQGGRVERGLAAVGGGDDQLGLRVQDVEGVGELGLDDSQTSG